MSAAIAVPSALVASDLLGAVEVPDEARYTFAAGLYGFDDRRRFALVPAGSDGLYWLQSEEEAGLCFLLADPFTRFAEYEIDLPEAELAQLGAPAAPGELALLVVVTLGRDPRASTCNLQAPVVLNAATRQGRQVVVPDPRYSVKTPLAIG